MPIRLRHPNTQDLALLNALTLRSKQSHGYDQDFIEACKAELEITPQILAEDDAVLAEDASGLAGVAQVSHASEESHLEKLFVDPDRFGEGIGRKLFSWAVDKARRHGAKELVIDSDPDAVAFYEAMGARQTGFAPSGSIPGRKLPQLRLKLEGRR